MIRRTALGVRHSLDANTKSKYNLPVRYEWDETKRAENLRKHGLDIFKGREVYEAEFKATLESQRGQELRFKDIAEVGGVMLAFVYTMRGSVIRCISLRRAKRTERGIYDAAIQNR
jgi:hypothetical protein